MDKLMQIRAFVRVAERASFSAVARDLQVTQPAVSKAITALERVLGVRLVNRNTRCVSLTEAGRRYYERCRQILSDLEEADAAVRNLSCDTVGTLNVAAPVPFGLMFISPRVVRFKALYPSLAINLDLNDQPLNLVEQNIDIAIRLGHLNTPGLVGRKLGESPLSRLLRPRTYHFVAPPRRQRNSFTIIALSIPIRPTRWSGNSRMLPATGRSLLPATTGATTYWH